MSFIYFCSSSIYCLSISFIANILGYWLWLIINLNFNSIDGLTLICKKNLFSLDHNAFQRYEGDCSSLHSFRCFCWNFAWRRDAVESTCLYCQGKGAIMIWNLKVSTNQIKSHILTGSGSGRFRKTLSFLFRNPSLPITRANGFSVCGGGKDKVIRVKKY